MVEGHPVAGRILRLDADGGATVIAHGEHHVVLARITRNRGLLVLGEEIAARGGRVAAAGAVAAEGVADKRIGAGCEALEVLIHGAVGDAAALSHPLLHIDLGVLAGEGIVGLMQEAAGDAFGGCLIEPARIARGEVGIGQLGGDVGDGGGSREAHQRDDCCENVFHVGIIR